MTLNYVAIPNFPQKNIDPTFIASVFTGVLATFGVQTAKSKNNGNGGKPPAPAVSKADMEKLIEKASQTAPAQIIRIEQAPLNLTAAATSEYGPTRRDRFETEDQGGPNRPHRVS